MVAAAYLATQFEGSARVCAALAALGMIGVGAISEAINRPIWRRIEKWTYASMPADWEQLRKTWSTAHTLRTASAFLAVVFFCATAVIGSRSARSSRRPDGPVRRVARLLGGRPGGRPGPGPPPPGGPPGGPPGRPPEPGRTPGGGPPAGPVDAAGFSPVSGGQG